MVPACEAHKASLGEYQYQEYGQFQNTAQYHADGLFSPVSVSETSASGQVQPHYHIDGLCRALFVADAGGSGRIRA